MTSKVCFRGNSRGKNKKTRARKFKDSRERKRKNPAAEREKPSDSFCFSRLIEKTSR